MCSETGIKLPQASTLEGHKFAAFLLESQNCAFCAPQKAFFFGPKRPSYPVKMDNEGK